MVASGPVRIGCCIVTLVIAPIFAAPGRAADAAAPAAATLASQFEWHDMIGVNPKDDKNVLTLMGQGFLGFAGLGQPTFSPELGNQVTTWMKQHPNAHVVPVYRTSLDEETSFLFVWVVDGDESLNVFLVRQGSCAAQNMRVPDTDHLLVSKEAYAKFDAAITEAERLGKETRH